MLSVIIDNNLLSIKKKESRGLINGLKKIYDFGFEIIINGFNKTDYENLYNIFELEEIKISNKSSFDRIVLISLNHNKSFLGEQIIINPKGIIKTFYDAVNELMMIYRTSTVQRTTKETDIKISVSLDGIGKSSIKTGIGFFDHILEQIARHGNIILNILVKGDLKIDEHHTVEDTGIALGEALLKSLGDKKGIKRYGYYLPMDDSIAKCAIDLGGRIYLNYNCEFKRDYVGEFPTELVEEFFRGLAAGLKANIYIDVQGKNDHHKIENIFKAFAKSLNEACRLDERTHGLLPSTKGIL